jgi:hypothetical protein
MGLTVKKVGLIGKESKNPKDLHKDVENLPKIILDRFKADFDTEMEFFVERARQNAPILEGELRDSIQFRSEINKTLLRGEVFSEAPHALRMHEGEYGLGEISRMQPTTKEGGVGNKFIERGMFRNAAEVGVRLGKAQQRILKQLEREAKQ